MLHHSSAPTQCSYALHRTWPLIAWIASVGQRREKLQDKFRVQEWSYVQTRFRRWSKLRLHGNRPIVTQHRSRRLAPPILADTHVTGEVAYRSLSNRSLRVGKLELSSAILLSSFRLTPSSRRLCDAVALGKSVLSTLKNRLNGEVVHLSAKFIHL